MLKNSDLAEAIRRTAYFFWEFDGCPDGKALDYWLRAKEMHQRHMAYDRWLAAGTPEGNAETHWEAAADQLRDK